MSGLRASPFQAIEFIAEPECTQLLMCFVLDVTIVWAGTTTKRPITHRNTRKVSLAAPAASVLATNLRTGKYLLEREKLIKENSWKLDA
jgi:hypothetical protein